MTDYETKAIDAIVAGGKLQKDIDKAQAWTKEPWHYEDGPNFRSLTRFSTYSVLGGDSHGLPLAEVGAGHEDIHTRNEDSNALSNAARIVACVNALANIPDPAAFVERAKKTEEALKSIADFCSIYDHDQAGRCMCRGDKNLCEAFVARQALKASE